MANLDHVKDQIFAASSAIMKGAGGNTNLGMEFAQVISNQLAPIGSEKAVGGRGTA